MVTETGIQEQDLNEDSNGLFEVLRMFNGSFNPNFKQKNIWDDDKTLLGTEDITTLFRSSNLIRKIITRYPAEAKTLGYQLKRKNGTIVNENDDILLNAFENASIFARLYAQVYLLLKFDDTNDNQPIKPNSELSGYEIHFDLKLKGDFYVGKEEKIRFHKSKISRWVGQKNYLKEQNPENVNYADSVLVGLYQTYNNYIQSNNLVRDILSNISYLTIGINKLADKLVSEKGRNQILHRLLSVNANRSVEKLIAYDKDSEVINFISQTLAGVREVVLEIKDLFVSETDYPYDILFEDSPKNSLGSGTQNQLVQRFLWAKRCHTWTVNQWLRHYQEVFVVWMPDDTLTVEIPFRFEMTPMEEAELEGKAADRTAKLITAGVITPEEAREGYQGDKFTLNIALNDGAFRKANLSPEPQEPQITQTDSVNLADAEWDRLAEITEDEILKIAQEILQKKYQKDSIDKKYFAKAEDIDIDTLPFETKIFEIQDNGRFIYGVGYQSEEEAEEAYLVQNPNALDTYQNIVNITQELQNLINQDSLNLDKGKGGQKVKGNLCRDANGRFTACGGANSGGSTGKKTTTTTEKITSKTNLAQLKAIAEKHGIEKPKNAQKRESWREAIRNHPEGKKHFETGRTKKVEIKEPKPEPKPSKPKTTKKKILDEELTEIVKNTDRSDYNSLIKTGNKLTKKHIDDTWFRKEEEKALYTKKEDAYDNYIKINAARSKNEKINGKKVLLKDLKEAEMTSEKAREEYTNFILERNKKVDEGFNNLRQDLIKRGISVEEATKLVDQINLKNIQNEEVRKVVRQNQIEFFQLTGGQGSKNLTFMLADDDRAYASKLTKVIDVGNVYEKSTHLHEFFHHVEYGSENVTKAANAFRNSRATSQYEEQLRIITGNKNYEANEFALPGKFINPYVGKIYGNKFNGTTEVVAMGGEHFHSHIAMKRLYQKDPEHFNFIVGIILTRE
ncbi:MAG: DUF1073 domain-containing protein [Iphinoe sp. HA4291-MV1]|jgi:hypothetical protein|nr:DUF1073 domain-containing protein [Iphinoe sp. HA4291-MV1]